MKNYYLLGIACLCIAFLSLPLLAEYNHDIFQLFDPYFFVNKIQVYNCWPDQIKKSCFLFQNLPCPNDHPGCHAGNMAFRFTIPFLLKLLKYERYVYYSQVFLGIYSLYAVYLISTTINKSRTINILFLLCFITTYSGYAFIYEFRGLGDALAFSFMIAALQFRNLLIQFICLQIAYWTDERAIIGSVGIGIYWLVINGEEFMKSFKFSKVTKFIYNDRPTQVLLLSWFSYFLVRIILSTLFGLHTPKEDANLSIITDRTFASVVVVFLNSHKFFIVFFFIAGYYLYQIKAWFIMLLLSTYFIGYHITSHMVYDNYRSLGFGFPIYFITFYMSSLFLTYSKMRRLMFIGAIVNGILFPVRHIVVPLNNLLKISVTKYSNFKN